MATRRRAVTRSRITTRSSKAKHQERDDQDQQQEHTTTASQASTVTAANLVMSADPCSPSPMKKSGRVFEATEGEDEDVENGGCWSTPKAKRFRIPEIESCPPAPKKQRAGSVGTCSLRTSSIPFFTPPELAEFFFRVSVPKMSTV